MSGQLIQIKRSNSNKASTLALNAGELAYSTVETSSGLYSTGENHSEIWIGKAGATSPVTGEKIFSSDLIHAWDNDRFVMKGDADGTDLILGNTTVTSLSSSGTISGTTASFSGDLSTTGGVSATGSVTGSNLAITDGGISTTSSNGLSLSSTNNQYSLGSLDFDGLNGATTDQILQADSTGKFVPTTLDVTAQARAAFTEGTGINITAGAIETDNSHIQDQSRNSITVVNAARLEGEVNSSLSYDSSTGAITFRSAPGVSLGQGETNLELSSDGTLTLNTANLIVNKAENIDPSALNGHSPSFAGMALTEGNFVVGNGVDVNFSENKLNNVGDPIFSHQAANKKYVDSVATGLGILSPVKAATNSGSAHIQEASYVGASGTLTAQANGIFALDGVSGFTIKDINTSTEASRILVKNRANAWENGIYDVTSLGDGSTPWVLTRSSDADESTELPQGSFVFVEEGNQANTGWVVGEVSGTTFGQDQEIRWSQFSATGAVDGSSTIAKNGNELSVAVSSNSALTTAEGLGIRVDGEGAIQISESGGLEVKADTTSGLVTTSGGISVVYDNSLLVNANNELSVNADPKHFNLSGDLELNLAANGGISDTGGNLSVRVDPTGAISVGTNGIGVVVSDAADNAISATVDGLFAKSREVDDASISLTGNVLSVKESGITNAMLAGGIDLANKVMGLLPAANGGLGVSPLNGLVFGDGSGYSSIANGTEGQIMTVNASGAPVFATMDGGSF